MQVADGDGRDALRDQPLQRPRDHALVDAAENPAVRQRALGHLDDARPRDERRGQLREEVEHVGNAMAADVEDVAEALGDEQRRARALTLDDRVHRERGAVHERADRRGIGAVLARERLDPGEDRRGRPFGCGRELQDCESARGLVEEREVREGAADVDAEAQAPHAVTRSRKTRCAPASSTAIKRICRVEAAAIVGSGCHTICEKMCTGSVTVSGPLTKRAMLMSLKDTMNAKTAPETTLERISGRVTFAKACARAAPRLIAASSSERSAPASPAETVRTTYGIAITRCPSTRPATEVSHLRRE